MHYIRFLKAPKFEVEKSFATLKSLITITSDLGDDFLAADLSLHALLVQGGGAVDWKGDSILATVSFTWRTGSRSLWLTIPKKPISALKSPVRFLITTKLQNDMSSLVPYATLKSLPNVLPAWSEPFGLTNNGTMNWVERRLMNSETVTLRICEEMGESIARHVWDAGVVMAAYIHDAILLPLARTEKSRLARILRMPCGPKVIELGSGCGLVGLQIAHMSPKAHVILTDLPEAMEVLQQNISIATLAPESHVSKAVLDWNECLPAHVAEQVFDLVIVSDCTYNADSIPALVRTLATLIKKSPEAMVVVAIKVRHTSEAVFHELMVKSGLRESSHWEIETPSAMDAKFRQDTEKVDIYTYES